MQWPANAPHVLAVGLRRRRDNGVSARGANLDLVAPGSNLLLPDLTGKWESGDGAPSFSSPIVAGAAARVWGAHSRRMSRR